MSAKIQDCLYLITSDLSKTKAMAIQALLQDIIASQGCSGQSVGIEGLAIQDFIFNQFMDFNDCLKSFILVVKKSMVNLGDFH